VDRQDVRVLELGGQLDFAQEAIGAQGRAEFGAEQANFNL
jgi:hypothetical protein